MDLSSFNITKDAADSEGLSEGELFAALEDSLASCKVQLKKVLILPPDFTRLHSGAGKITNYYYNALKDTAQVDILPTLGTHVPMTDDEIDAMYGDIPHERFLVHNWRKDVVTLGEVPGDFVSEVSEGLSDSPIKVEVNRLIVDGGYDLILSVGQVVPHEVVGMANRNKNVFVGCGGSDMINSSHMLGAFYGMERIMGKDFSPVRKVFDYAEEHYLANVPLKYVLTVTTQTEGNIHIHGLFIGRERKYFEQAVELSQKINLQFVDRPFKKVVVLLDEKEFKSTWLGNKSIYRTRMAIADGGELIVLAAGIDKFGEDDNIDALIRKYGYCGRLRVLELVKEHEDLKANLSAAAHLIHGSSDDRFSITYCPKHMSKQEIEGVCYNYMPYDEAVKRYDPEVLTDGYNVLPDGEEIYYFSNSVFGLLADRKKF